MPLMDVPEPHTSPYAGLTTPLTARLYAFGPDDERLDPERLVTAAEPGRWNDAGAPAIYLPADPGVLLAEWGRAFGVERPFDVALWSVVASLARALDLRRPVVRAALDLPEPAAWILDPDQTRDLAADARYRGGVDGLVVPSAAFLDDPDRWSLVAFLGAGQTATDVVADPERVGRYRWAPGVRPRRRPGTRPARPTRRLLGLGSAG
jgi:RES domain-containing protein